MSICDCQGWDSKGNAPRRGALSRAVETREAKRRIEEAARMEINRYYQEQRNLDHATGNMVKDDFKRKDREARERAGEAHMLNTLYQNEQAKVLATIRADEEEKIATALQKRQLDKDRHDREVQKLREQSAELRELAEKVRTAKVNKERSMQMQEKQQIKQQQAEYEHAFNQYVEQSEAAAAAREAEFQQRRREMNVKARMVLEEQMQEKQDALRQAEEEWQRERAMVDEIVRRIQEEDAAEAALRRQKVSETKDFIAKFLAQQDEAKRQKVQMEAAEQKRIDDYWTMVRDREAQEAAKAAMRKEAADRMYEKIKREMEEEQRKREEEEELINLLRQEELEAKRRAEEEEKKRKAEAMRLEIQQANEYQMRLREEREAQMKAEEEEFRRRMMAKFAEDDRIEQLNAQKRRMKVVEHGREVQRMIEDKRQMYEEQKRREEAALAAARLEEERLAGILEEERRKLLREAAELRDYLPRGVIRDQADLDYINRVLAEQKLGKQ